MRDLAVEMFGRLLMGLSQSSRAQVVLSSAVAFMVSYGAFSGSQFASMGAGLFAFIGGMVLGCAFAVDVFVNRRG